MAEQVHSGQPAPDFTLVDQDNTPHTLSAYRGRPVVLLFYPFDFSPICTEEHACMVNVMSRFNALSAQVFGISVDSHYTHNAYGRQQGITYPLLADFHPKGAVAQAYGFYNDVKGRASRAVVIIDPQGQIVEAHATGDGTLPDVERIAARVASLATFPF